MFTNQGIQPVSVVFNNAKNCFLHLPYKLISHLSLSENQALELSWGDGAPVFLSWTVNRGSSSQDSHTVELCRQLGEKLGLKDGEQGLLRPCHQVSSLHQVFVEPLSSDDWEILELHSSELEQQLLNQIRVVFQDAVFPIWVDNHTVLFIQIASLSPSVPHGRLEQFTELVVSPKNRAGTGTHRGPPLRSSREQFLPGQQSKASSSGPTPDRISPSASSHQWGGIADLKSLFRYVTGPANDPVEEAPPVPSIPIVFNDSVYRVCGAPPESLGGISHVATSVIHLLPWYRGWNDVIVGCQAPVTYGLLSKMASPKESREKIKQATVAKKTVGAPADGAPAGKGETKEEEEEEEETLVVRVVCHDAEEITGRKRSVVEIYTGRVWIPELLTSRLNIEPHSAVRIKPVKSAIKVATCILLQPVEPLPEEDDEEIQMAFLSWVHTQSHEPLACLTARSGTVLLHGTDEKSAFTLTVLKPEPKSDPPDQLFLLSPIVIKKENIQVGRTLAAAPPVKVAADALRPDLPSLRSLGGVGELGETGFEFISHSLLSGPLSQELGFTARGLRGGALLITGAKGNGKSALSRGLCRRAEEDLDAHVEVVDCKKLQGKRADTVRQILLETFEQAEWRHPSVVLLDDLDQLAPAPTSHEHEHGPEALLHLHIAQSLKDVVHEVARHSCLVCLLVTSQSEHSLHPSLTQVQGCHFFQGFVNIQPPDAAQRADIMRHLILGKSCSSFCEETSPTLDLGAVATETEGYTPQDLALLLKRATHTNMMRKGRSDQGLCLTWSDFEEALKGFTPPSRWGVDLHAPSGFGLERVGGLKEVRQELMDTILLPAKYPILFANLPIRHRSGVLLYGAPGTGKTLLARAIAKESGMSFISIKGPELLSKYIGASEQAVRDVFQRAQAAKPCIMFFDEFDSLAPRRGHDSTGVTDRVVNQLLTALDGVEGLQGVYVLAATSRPDLIDPALLRPGRLDKSLYCPPPDQEARLEILTALSTGVPLAPDVDLQQLAAATRQFTGADLRALIYNAQLEAVHSRMATNPTPELACGSDSDMSLSSMAFPTNSSGSDESVGELEQSMVLLEHSELHGKDEQLQGNMWRLYFGSSYETESGSPSSGVNSRCVSGPNSGNQDFPAEAARDQISLVPPAYMPSLRDGIEELSPEQQERLQEEVNTIKKNHRRGNQERVWESSASGQPSLLVCQAHLKAALAATRPSLSLADWATYAKLYEGFGAFGEKKSDHVAVKPGQRATLA